MKTSRAVSAALGSIIACSALIGAQLPAEASAPPSVSHKPAACINKGEYARVLTGTPRTKVHKLIGTTGTRMSLVRSAARATEVRSYDVCKSPDSTVTITFVQSKGKPFRVTHKTAIWVV